MQNMTRPTAILNADTARRNIQRMAEKARRSGVRFRPHFKTHQSAAVGEWFRAEGVETITVSSLAMAGYFAAHGWRDITVAFPVNWREIDTINALAGQIRLNLVLESPESAAFLAQNLVAPVGVWLKVDTGYHRTGIDWDAAAMLQATAQAVLAGGENLRLAGLLTHAGHSYKLRSTAAIGALYDETVARLAVARQHTGVDGLAISLGDTPCCSVVEDMSAVDEVRPGAFVFYDVMQVGIGACGYDDLAVAVACPVVAKHTRRGQVIIYGGAVHLSKDHLTMPDGNPSYGEIALPSGAGWGAPLAGCYVASLSQEHGIVNASDALLQQVKVGDVLMVLPIHICLTADLLRRYQTLDGHWLEMGRF